MHLRTWISGLIPWYSGIFLALLELFTSKMALWPFPSVKISIIFEKSPLIIRGLNPKFRLLQVTPSRFSALVLSTSRLSGYLVFSLNIKATGSRNSLEKPKLESRLLYTGYRPPNMQAPDGLISSVWVALDFDNLLAFTMLSTEVQDYSSF